MKEKIKKFFTLINHWKIILVILLVGAGLFYWYEWRPTQIRKECSKECSGFKSAISTKLGFDCYKDCLYKKGINK